MLLTLPRTTGADSGPATIQWGPKQRQYGHIHTLKKSIFARGSIRSGKSKALCHGWAKHLHDRWAGYDHMLAGIDYKAVNGIYIPYLEEACWQMGLKMTGHETSHLEIPSKHGPPNRIWCFGGRAREAAERALGYTFATGLFGEVVRHSPQFVANSWDRFSVPGARIMADYNPEGPMHWFRINYELGIQTETPDGRLEQVLPHLTIHRLEDNPSLSAAYIAETKGRYRNNPSEYARKVQGEWATQAGLIYAMVLLPAEHDTTERHEYRNVMSAPSQPPDYLCLGVDYGERGVTAAALIGFWESTQQFHQISEWRHDGKVDGYETDEQQATGLADWAHSQSKQHGERISDIFVDATAKGLIKQLRKRIRAVRPIQFDLVPSVKIMQQIFETHTAYIAPQCRHTLAELGNYHWDENSKSEDRIADKQQDHHLDASRYGILGAMTRQSRQRQHRAMIATATRIAA